MAQEQEYYDGMDDMDEELMGVLDTMPEQAPHERPMSEDSDLLNILLSKDEVLNSPEVPADIKSVMIFYNKTLALSNISRKDVFHIIEGFDDLKVSMLMSRPKIKFTWKEEMYWTAVKRWLQIEATRGVDGFERTMEATQIQQIQQEQTRTDATGTGGSGVLGFLSKSISGGKK